jgi:hypothetical protein
MGSGPVKRRAHSYINKNNKLDGFVKQQNFCFERNCILVTLQQTEVDHVISLNTYSSNGSQCNKKNPVHLYVSRDSSVGIALGYGLDDWGSRVRFLASAGNFSLHHRVQNGSLAHPASYPMGARGSFPGGKRQGREADHSPPSSAEVNNVWSYTSTPQYAFMVWCSVTAQKQIYIYTYLLNRGYIIRCRRKGIINKYNILSKKKCEND